MKYSRLVLAAVAVLGFTTAQANQTEQFFQAEDGKNIVKPFFSIGQMKADKTSSGESTVDYTQFGVEYERGLSAMYSLGAQLAFTNIAHPIVASSGNGLDRLHFFMKGNNGGGFNWGLNLDYNTDDGTGTEFSPQYPAMSYGLFLGKAFDNGWGVRFDYGAHAETDAKFQAGTNMTLTGFYEHDAMDAHWGYSFGYVMNATDKTNSVDNKNGNSKLNLKAYHTCKVGDAEMVAGLGYNMGLASDDDDIKSSSEFVADLGYRMSF